MAMSEWEILLDCIMEWKVERNSRIGLMEDGKNSKKEQGSIKIEIKQLEAIMEVDKIS